MFLTFPNSGRITAFGNKGTLTYKSSKTTVAKMSTVSRGIGSLTKGKIYYVRIRTYETVGSAKYWSEWGAAKCVKNS